jgi:hypothetical protein
MVWPWLVLWTDDDAMAFRFPIGFECILLRMESAAGAFARKGNYSAKLV